MNKEDFINELKVKTGLTEEQCMTVNMIFEKTYLAGKKNKELIINQLCEKLNITEKQAEIIYSAAVGLLAKGAIHKVKGHFKKK